ncbi:MAG: NADH:flavin oxidoreductase, partial [Acidimicrobiales bacterium]
MNDTNGAGGGAAAGLDPFAPAQLGPVELRNRIIKAATFEGVTPDALVTEELIDYHRRHAAGGVGMSTVAYLAVAPEGRTQAECIWLRDSAVPGLRELTDAIHAEGAAAAAQIGHAGPVANGRSNGAPGLAPSRGFSPLSMRPIRATTETDLERITMDFGRAGRLAVESGFDAIEVHLGHNYLPSSFLSPSLNRRKDRWGGSVENRARFSRQVVRAVREAAGDDVAVTAKLNMVDGYPGGMRIEDSLVVAAMLQEDGALDAIELTGGSSFANPMYLFRGDAPLEEFTETLPQPMKTGFRLFGKKLMPTYPFEEAFFLENAKQFRRQLSMPLILLGGINHRSTIELAMGEGFEFVAMARALLHDPELINKMQSGEQTEGECIHCNRCMPTIYSGTRCVLNDPEPLYP